MPTSWLLIVANVVKVIAIEVKGKGSSHSGRKKIKSQCERTEKKPRFHVLSQQRQRKKK